MQIAVLGTGMVGRALAGRFHEIGHHVTIGTRKVEATLARTEPDAMGNEPYTEWASHRPGIGLATFAEAENLAGKVLLDVANPPDLWRALGTASFNVKIVR